MTNILISGKAMALKTVIAKSIARSLSGTKNIQVYTNDAGQYLEEEGFDIIEFGHDGVYESHEIKIENGHVVLIDEYICPFFKIPNKIDDEISNYSIIIVVRSLSDVDGNAWWLLSHRHGYRYIDVGDMMDVPMLLESTKRNNVSLSLKVEVDEFNRVYR